MTIQTKADTNLPVGNQKTAGTLNQTDVFERIELIDEEEYYFIEFEIISEPCCIKFPLLTTGELCSVLSKLIELRDFSNLSIWKESYLSKMMTDDAGLSVTMREKKFGKDYQMYHGVYTSNPELLRLVRKHAPVV